MFRVFKSYVMISVTMGLTLVLAQNCNRVALSERDESQLDSLKYTPTDGANNPNATPDCTETREFQRHEFNVTTCSESEITQNPNTDLDEETPDDQDDTVTPGTPPAPGPVPAPSPNPKDDNATDDDSADTDGDDNS